MLRNAIWIMFFGLIVAGCASDSKVETMESSGGTSSTTAGGGAAVSSPAMSDAAGTQRTESNSTNQPNSSRSRIAAGIEEETLDTCVAHIPKDATAGQKMMAEQTCQRNYPSRR